LCSSCCTFINPSYYKGHLTKHFVAFKGKKKEEAITKAISILNELQVSSLPQSLNLINAFVSTNVLLPLQELEVLSSLFKCSFCDLIKFSKYYIQRHLREEHKGFLEEIESLNLLNSYIVIAKRQSLEKNKYFF
jgi:hypothetical protein